MLDASTNGQDADCTRFFARGATYGFAVARKLLSLGVISQRLAAALLTVDLANLCSPLGGLLECDANGIVDVRAVCIVN